MAENNKKVKTNRGRDIMVKVVAGMLAGIMVLAFAGTLVMCLVNI